MSNFQQAFEWIVEAEGGYTNDPNDSGGETNFGISKRAYPQLDIKSLTLAQAEKIYREDYWNRVNADLIPSPLNIMLFDGAVNHGVKASVRLLQRVLLMTEDGVLGEKTLAALKQRSITEVCANYMTQRAILYTKQENQAFYLKGWLNRLFKLSLRSNNGH